MAKDKSRPDLRDAGQISPENEYEVKLFALQNNITPDQVRVLIREHGNGRATLTEAAKALPGR
ncbi:DUF3606 domain-containing protein [Mesorhizobium sp. M9A.F.Ca.ET.002.03.1.2]|uniref:DUF3606 domain-containing protein n=1 Tax=Mesorhizobium sp. M9A.F.Ca.ET.002.03.1.2 TaxID=2493668 RepID=UPI000F7539AE|nr:DUF3606 domain-containing protein [Mesorhizobium sp. M9A.F.Ca.ET.002.03.1.2]AZN98732.1 DUF3606 domain-containing protein [Mesorhizobium sp. M9A.F.Ca.ET.002.03.1.2]